MNSPPLGIIRSHRPKLVFIFRLSDAFIISLILLVALYVRGIPVDDKYFLAVLFAVSSFSIISSSCDAYRLERGVKVLSTLWPILFTWAITMFILFSLAYFFKTSSEYSRIVIATWFTITPIMLVSWRIFIYSVLSHFRSKGYNTRSVAIAGASSAGDRVGCVINKTPSYGLKLVGYFDNRKGKRATKNLPAPMLGDFDELIFRAKKKEFDLIYIALAFKGEEQIADLISKLSDTTASVHLVPDFSAFNLLHSQWINLGSVPTISIHDSAYSGIDSWSKRIEDIILSTIILGTIAIPLVFISIGVKLSSPGSILFKQRRYGVDGKSITIWKFRTMTTQDDGETIVQAKKNDVRVTPFGGFLRRTSLDELPQFINVLKGDMSIVGPRPHAVAHNEEYRKLISGYMLRHKVKPGITGWAQVNGWRGETDTLDKMEKRIEFDLDYICYWSLWWDLRIIGKTITTGFVGKNTY